MSIMSFQRLISLFGDRLQVCVFGSSTGGRASYSHIRSSRELVMRRPTTRQAAERRSPPQPD